MSKLAQMVMEWLDEFNAKWPARPKIPNACLDSLVELVERIVGEENERLRGDYESSHASRVHADTAVLRLEAEVERLEAEKAAALDSCRWRGGK